MLSLVGVVTAVTSANVGAVVSDLTPNSSFFLPHEEIDKKKQNIRIRRYLISHCQMIYTFYILSKHRRIILLSPFNYVNQVKKWWLGDPYT